MILHINEGEHKYLVTALEVYREELENVAEAVHSRMLKVGFEQNADTVRFLLSRVLDLRESDFNEVQKQTVRQFLADGQKIHAIRYIRTQTNLGLKDAKEVVDRIEQES